MKIKIRQSKKAKLATEYLIEVEVEGFEYANNFAVGVGEDPKRVLLVQLRKIVQRINDQITKEEKDYEQKQY